MPFFEGPGPGPGPLYKVCYSLLGKAFEKQTKIIEEQGKKVEAVEVLKPEENKEEIKSVKGLFPKGMRTNEIKNEIDEIKKWEEKIRPQHLVYKVNKYKYDFEIWISHEYGTTRSFDDSKIVFIIVKLVWCWNRSNQFIRWFDKF